MQRRAVILLYHRVAELDVDPWGLAVRPESFDAHLAALAERADVLPLAELVERVAARTLPRRSVAITFDDGYADNLHAAAPILGRHGTPATMFVTSGAVGTGREFWWDELESLVLDGPLPPRLELDLAGTRRAWDFSGPSTRPRSPTAHRGWRAWTDNANDPQRALFFELWSSLQPLGDADKQALLDALARVLGKERRARDTHRTMSAAEVKELAGQPGITVGAHTVTHARLGDLPEAEQREEMGACRRQLEALVGQSVTLFSLPFGGRGDYTPATLDIARATGFVCACANEPGALRNGESVFDLPRCTVPDVDGPRFARLLDAWLGAA